MRNIVLIIVSIILGVLTLFIGMTIDGRMNRSVELKSSLSSAIEETVENMAVKEKYSINNVNEYIADFVEDLSASLDADSDIMVKVLKMDKEKGILSLRVTESFTHPNGEAGTVECERNVILNKVDKLVPEKHIVSFYLTKADMDAGRACYKSYVVYEGDILTVPVEPRMDGASFAGWVASDGYMADFSLPVEQDRCYYAEWQ